MRHKKPKPRRKLMKYTPAPWSVITQEDSNDSICIGFYGDKRKYCLIGIMRDHGKRDSMMANANRIVSCVNALDGIHNPEEFVAAVKELFNVKKPTSLGMTDWEEWLYGAFNRIEKAMRGNE